TAGRILYTVDEGNKAQLVSIAVDGSDRRALANVDSGDELTLSPDGRWIAFTFRQDAYIAEVPAVTGSEPLELRSTGGSFPIYPVSDEGASYLTWLDGGKRLIWSWGPMMWSLDLAGYGPDKKTKPTATAVSFEVPRPETSGRVLLRN